MLCLFYSLTIPAQIRFGIFLITHVSGEFTHLGDWCFEVSKAPATFHQSMASQINKLVCLMPAGRDSKVLLPVPLGWGGVSGGARFVGGETLVDILIPLSKVFFEESQIYLFCSHRPDKNFSTSFLWEMFLCSQKFFQTIGMLRPGQKDCESPRAYKSAR